MLRRATVWLLAGWALMGLGLLGLGAMPVLADEPGDEPSPPPSSDPSPTPSPSISPTPSPTPSASPSPSFSTTDDASATPSYTPKMAPTPGGTAWPRYSGENPVKVHGAPGGVGRLSQQRPVLQAAETASVAAIDDEFRPTPLTVAAGTTVVWTNEGQNPHTVTANDRAFDSGTLEPGQTFSATFDEVGQIAYYCQIHGEPGSGMTGVVVVQAAPDEEGGEGPSPPGSDGVAATGADPIPLGIAALVLATVGLAALRASRRALEGGDGEH